MKSNRITTKQNEDCHLFKDVYLDGKCIGKVMADDTYTPQDCYDVLMNNWHIDQLEAMSDEAIDRLSTY